MKISIASGKGGTGKTFVSTNLFRLMHQHSPSVVLVDCDVEVPNSHVFLETTDRQSRIVTDFRPVIDLDKCRFCGKCVEYCHYNAMLCVPSAHITKMLPDLCHGCTACMVACPHGAISASDLEIGQVTAKETADGSILIEGRMAVNTSSGVPVIHDTVAFAEKEYPADYYLLDSPPGTSCPFIQTTAKSDLVLLVTEPTPFGLSDLIQAMDTLDSLGKPYCVVINRADMGDDQMEQVLADRGVDVIARIPFSREIASCYAGGQLVVDELPDHRVYFEQILDHIRLIEANQQHTKDKAL